MKAFSRRKKKVVGFKNRKREKKIVIGFKNRKRKKKLNLSNYKDLNLRPQEIRFKYMSEALGIEEGREYGEPLNEEKLVKFQKWIVSLIVRLQKQSQCWTHLIPQLTLLDFIMNTNFQEQIVPRHKFFPKPYYLQMYGLSVCSHCMQLPKKDGKLYKKRIDLQKFWDDYSKADPDKKHSVLREYDAL